MTDFSSLKGHQNCASPNRTIVARVPQRKASWMPDADQLVPWLPLQPCACSSEGKPGNRSETIVLSILSSCCFCCCCSCPILLPSHLCPEVSCYVLGRLSERKERCRGIVAHDLLQLVDLFRDIAKSGLHKHRERADGKSDK